MSRHRLVCLLLCLTTWTLARADVDSPLAQQQSAAAQLYEDAADSDTGSCAWAEPSCEVADFGAPDAAAAAAGELSGLPTHDGNIWEPSATWDSHLDSSAEAQATSLSLDHSAEGGDALAQQELQEPALQEPEQQQQEQQQQQTDVVTPLGDVDPAAAPDPTVDQEVPEPVAATAAAAAATPASDTPTQQASEPATAVPSTEPGDDKAAAQSTPGPSPPAATAAAPTVTAAQLAAGLSELRGLLLSARQAVTALEAAVQQQEQRLRSIAAAATAAAAAGSNTAAVSALAGGEVPALPGAAAADIPGQGTALGAASGGEGEDGGAAGTNPDTTIAEQSQQRDAGASGNGTSDVALALLHSLGLDAETSLDARQALRDAVQLLLSERGGPGAPRPHPPAALPPQYQQQQQTAAGVTLSGMSGVGGVREWFSQHFSLAAAIITRAAVTCAFPFELPPAGSGGGAATSVIGGGGPLVYTVLGDAAGWLYLVSPAGSLSWQLHSGTHSAVTACSAYPVRKGESTVVTGHANGQTRSFAVQHYVTPKGAADGGGAGGKEGGKERPLGGMTVLESERKPGAGAGAGQGMYSSVVNAVVLRHVVEGMPRGSLPWAAVEELVGVGAGSGGQGAGEAGQGGPAGSAAASGAVGRGADDAAHYSGPPAPVMHILPYRLGGKPSGRRHVAVVDRAGNVRLERDNGTTRFWGRTNRTQLAARFVGNYVVMLSAHHTTVLNTLQPRGAKAFACQHLNGSRLLAASFDGHRPFRGYGINTRGELLSLVTPHEGRITSCKVHRATPLPFLDPAELSPGASGGDGGLAGGGGRGGPPGAPPAPAPLSLTPLPGYLLLTRGSLRALFNVTGLMRAGIPTLAAVDGAGVAANAAPAAKRVMEVDVGDTSTAADGASTGGDAAAASLPLTAADGSPLPPWLLPPVTAAGSNTHPMLILGVDPSAALAAAAAEAEAAAEGRLLAAAGPGAAAGGGMAVLLASRLPYVPPASGAGKMWTQPIFVGAMFLVGLYQFWRMSSPRGGLRRGGMMGGLGAARRAPRGGRPGAYGGAGAYSSGPGDGGDYGLGRLPLQPRSALRRAGGRDRGLGGRHVSYAEEYDDD